MKIRESPDYSSIHRSFAARQFVGLFPVSHMNCCVYGCLCYTTVWIGIHFRIIPASAFPARPDLKFETQNTSNSINVRNIVRSMIMKKRIVFSLFVCSALFVSECMAEKQDTGITAEKPYAVLNDGSNLIRIERTNFANDSTATASVSRTCPPYCVNPHNIADSVDTVAELEVIEFMESSYMSGEGVIVDVRTPELYAQGTIPGSINIPLTAFEQSADTNEIKPLLERFGVRARGEVGAVVRALEKMGLFGGEYKTDRWDFTAARDVLLWCEDALCEESPRAIRALLSLGYPPEKLFYYRGGMRMWQSLGLTTVVPESQSKFASK